MVNLLGASSMEINGVQQFDKSPLLSNQQTVNHQPDKFTIDFMGIFPQFNPDNKPNAVICHKVVIMDPHVAKGLLKALQDNIERYEKKFGQIQMPEPVKEEKDESTPSPKPSYMG